MSLKSTKKKTEASRGNKTQAASYLTSPENAALGVPHYNRKDLRMRKGEGREHKKGSGVDI